MGEGEQNVEEIFVHHRFGVFAQVRYRRLCLRAFFMWRLYKEYWAGESLAMGEKTFGG